LPRKALFQTLKAKLLTLAAIAIAIVCVLSILNERSLVSLLLVWNLSVLSAIVLWQLQRRKRPLEFRMSYTSDVRRTEVSFEKTRRRENKGVLIRYRAWLENALRRFDRTLKESDPNAMYSGSKSKLGKPEPAIDDSSRYVTSHKGTSKNDRKTDPSVARSRERWTVRRKAQLEMENKERLNLETTLATAEAIITNEPLVSLASALQPIVNDCKAHYNLIKRRDKLNFEMAGDYWLAWSLVRCLQFRLPFDCHIEKYASKNFRSRAKKFMSSVDAVRYSKAESLPVERKNVHFDNASDPYIEQNSDLRKSK
jgi:hypothetical protein